MTINTYKYQYDDERGERSGVLPEVNRSALSRDTGISRSQLSRILSGKVEPPLKTLRVLADALEASLDEVDDWLKELRVRTRQRRNGRRR